MLVEPVIVTCNEFAKLLAKKNPLVVEALERGVVLVDKLEIAKSRKTPAPC
ncbi:MAG: hypothetical protein ACP5KA_07305 [Desulfurococcaceae archaeon]